MLDSDSEEEGGKKKVPFHSNVPLMIELNGKTYSEVKTRKTLQLTTCQCSSCKMEVQSSLSQ